MNSNLHPVIVDLTDLGVYELDGAFRAGFPEVEANGILTKIDGLITASKVEFTVFPGESARLVKLGNVVGVSG